MRRQIYLTLLQILLILSCVSAKAQTRPRPEQLVNPQQVRIGATDTRPVTLVDSRQLGDGRYTDAPAWLTDPADAGKLTVCVVTFYGHSLEAGLLVVVRVPACYSQFGLALLLTDPIWLAWWNAQARP